VKGKAGGLLRNTRIKLGVKSRSPYGKKGRKKGGARREPRKGLKRA
jgi:hypothetical protein